LAFSNVVQDLVAAGVAFETSNSFSIIRPYLGVMDYYYFAKNPTLNIDYLINAPPGY
jgi:hypothetical protein